MSFRSSDDVLYFLHRPFHLLYACRFSGFFYGNTYVVERWNCPSITWTHEPNVSFINSDSYYNSGFRFFWFWFWVCFWFRFWFQFLFSLWSWFCLLSIGSPWSSWSPWTYGEYSTVRYGTVHIQYSTMCWKVRPIGLVAVISPFGMWSGVLCIFLMDYLEEVSPTPCLKFKGMITLCISFYV